MVSLPTRRSMGLIAAILPLWSAAGFAQDDAGKNESTDAASEVEEVAEATAAEGERIEDPELDVQGFDPTADDDFVPSEDIPADAPIAFPTDI